MDKKKYALSVVVLSICGRYTFVLLSQIKDNRQENSINLFHPATCCRNNGKTFRKKELLLLFVRLYGEIVLFLLCSLLNSGSQNPSLEYGKFYRLFPRWIESPAQNRHPNALLFLVILSLLAHLFLIELWLCQSCLDRERGASPH